MDTQLQIKANSAQCLLDVFANMLALSVLSLQLIPLLQEKKVLKDFRNNIDQVPQICCDLIL